MSEIQNPNKQPNYKLRRAVAASIAAVGVVGAGVVINEGVDFYKGVQEHNKLVDNLQRPDALGEYLKGDQLPRDKVVRLKVPDDMPPDSFSKLIKKDNNAQWSLTQQIKPQVDAQGYPGAEMGEQVVVEKALVDPDAIEAYGVPELSDQNVDHFIEQTGNSQ